MDRDLTTKKAVAVLLEEGSGVTVLVDTQSRHRFCLEVDQVVKACQSFQAGYEFFQQLEDLQDLLSNWVLQYKSRLNGAYITFRSTGDLLFVVVQKETERDDELVDLLTSLDISIASDERFTQLKVEVLQLPKTSRSSLDAFLSPDRVFEHAGYGESGSQSKFISGQRLTTIKY